MSANRLAPLWGPLGEGDDEGRYTPPASNLRKTTKIGVDRVPGDVRTLGERRAEPREFAPSPYGDDSDLNAVAARTAYAAKTSYGVYLTKDDPIGTPPEPKQAAAGKIILPLAPAPCPAPVAPVARREYAPDETLHFEIRPERGGRKVAVWVTYPNGLQKFLGRFNATESEKLTVEHLISTESEKWAAFAQKATK
jgi:hypothetical protein